MHHLFFLFVRIYTFGQCTWIQFNVIVKRQQKKTRKDEWMDECEKDEFVYRLRKRQWQMTLTSHLYDYGFICLSDSRSTTFRLYCLLRLDEYCYKLECSSTEIWRFYEWPGRIKRKNEMTQRRSAVAYTYWIVYNMDINRVLLGDLTNEEYERKEGVQVGNSSDREGWWRRLFSPLLIDEHHSDDDT